MGDRTGIWHYIKSYRFNSIFFKNFLLISFLIFLPLSGISIIAFTYLDNVARNEAGTANQNTISKVKDIIDMIAVENDRLSMRIATDEQVEALFTSIISEYPDYDTIKRISNIDKQIGMSTITSDYINSIYLYSERNDYIISTNLGGSGLKYFYDNSWKAEYDSRKNTLKSWTEFRRVKNKSTSGGYSNFITSFRMIPLYDYRKLGFVAINIDADKLGKLINDYNDKRFGGIYIIDEKDLILYNSDISLIGKSMHALDILRDISFEEDGLPVIKEVDGKKISVAFSNSGYNKWKYLSIVPMQQLEEKTGYLKDFIAIAISVIVLFMIGVAFIISIHVFKPIKNIISIIQNPGVWYGKAEKEGNKQNVNELKYIINNIMGSFSEGKKLEEELEQRLVLLKKAQAIALQSQINPHFLFNTLETVNWMAMKLIKQDNDVSSIITSLSQLLRISFSTQEHLIPILKELEHARCYLEIQQFRYKDKLDVIWEVDEGIVNLQTAKIVLQPLIENAIYHGIKPKEGKGTIWIRGYSESENVILEVSDDGVGMQGEVIKALAASMSADYIKEDFHIGLSNVNQRIKLLFGDNYGLLIKSESGLGTTVRLTLPKAL